MANRKRIKKGILIASTSKATYTRIKNNLIIVFYKESCFGNEIIKQIEHRIEAI